MVKNSKKILYFVVLVCLSILILVYAINKSNNILFCATLLLCCANILQSKVSMFSIFTLIITYIVLPVFVQDNFGRSYGVLESSELPLYAKEIYTYVSVFLFLLFTFITFTRILKKEKSLYKTNFYISNKILYTFCAGAIIFSIVAFPRLPFISSSRPRFEMLLPGGAWNHLALVFLIAISCRYKNSWCARLTGCFVCFWFLGNGERVDILGYVVGVMLFFLNRHKLKKLHYIQLIFVACIGIIILNFIGDVRSNSNNGLSGLIYEFVVQKTATDIAYVFNCCIHYSQNNLLYGSTYSYYLLNAFPILNAENQVMKILEGFASPGGEYLLCEPLINFGFIGIIVTTIAEFSFLSLIFSSRDKYFKYIAIFVIFTQFRIIWYGRSYIETAIIYFIPFLILIKSVLEMRVKSHTATQQKKKVKNT